MTIPPKTFWHCFKHPTRCLAAAAHFLIRKKLFNSKYPQLQVAKDFAVAEKKLHLTASRRKDDPGKKAHRKRMLQHLQKHQPLRNNSQHKATWLLVLNKNINHHNLAAMMMRHFQILFHLPRLLRQKIQNLFQRNQNLVQVKSKLVYSRYSFSQILIYCTCYYFYRYMQKAKAQTRELLPLCAF